MKFHLCHGAIALMLLGSAGMASAQYSPEQNSPGQSSGQNSKSNQNNRMSNQSSSMSGQQALNLSQDQKQTIWQAVSKQKSADSAPASFQPSVGAQVPSQIKLHPLPQTAAKQVPAAKNYQYAKLQNQVLLVDPANKTVVDIISQ
jgi:hypothetical protein